MLLRYTSIVLAAATMVTAVIAFTTAFPVGVPITLALATVIVGYTGRWKARPR
jgi:hypothetical protein